MSDLMKRAAMETPISNNELENQTMIKTALKRTLSMISKYKPEVIVGDTNMKSNPIFVARNIKLVEVISDPITSTPISSGVMLTNHYDSTFQYNKFFVDHTFESIYKSEDTWLIDTFESLYFSHLKAYAANIRRSADMAELPFDLKGDQFYQEALEEINDIKQILINSTPQLL